MTGDSSNDDISNDPTIGGVSPMGSPRSVAGKIETGTLKNGTTIGRYVLRKVVGRGGMGVVYVAFDPTLNRRIAIKILHGKKSFDDSEKARLRLLREAQAMAAIGHPNLVQVHDVGTYRGAVFIAMEFVNGRTLREWNAETTAEDWGTILKVYLSAASALQAAHDADLIHRDFKPDNVMLGFDSRVRVMDFGLARSTSKRKPDASMSGDLSTSDVLDKPLTATGMIMGTPAYMAPEQFLGEPTDERTDQFSFCVSLYEALYGYRPFQGKNRTAIAKAVMRGKIKLPDKKHPVPEYVLEALIKGLQCTPEDRFDSMRQLSDSLTEAPKFEATQPWLLYALIGSVAIIGVGWYWITARTLNRHTPSKRWDEHRLGVFLAEEIAEVEVMAKQDMQTCLIRTPDSGSITGTIAIEVLVDVAGRVEAWRVSNGDLSDTDVARCALGMAGSWPFPEPTDGPAQVTIPIVIRAGRVE